MPVIKELQKLLHCDADTAERVMDCSGLNYSECTRREFNVAARMAHDTLVAVRADMNAAHEHSAVLTANGHGSYCRHCGETLA